MKVWIVMEPKRFQARQRIMSTSHLGEGDAIRKAIRRWLPVEYFPDKCLAGDMYFGVMSQMWSGMEHAGWEIVEVDIDTEKDVHDDKLQDG